MPSISMGLEEAQDLAYTVHKVALDTVLPVAETEQNPEPAVTYS